MASPADPVLPTTNGDSTIDPRDAEGPSVEKPSTANVRDDASDDVSEVLDITNPSSLPLLAGFPDLDLPSLRRQQAKPRPRLWVFADPLRAFAAVVARPRPVLMLALAVAFALLPPIAFLARAERDGGIQEVMVDEMRKSGSWEKIPPEKRPDVLRAVGPLMTVVIPVTAVGKRVAGLGFLFVVAFLVLRGTRPTLTPAVVWSTVVVGAFPLFLHDVLAASALTFFPSRGLDPQNAVMSNLAAFFTSGAESRSAWAAVLRGVDVFDIWTALLTATGLTQVAITAGGRTHFPYALTFGAHIVATLVGAIAASAAR